MTQRPPTSSMLSPPQDYQEILQQCETRWNEIGRVAEHRLLKLLLLRDLMNRLHVLRSQHLALGLPYEPPDIHLFEQKIQHLKFADLQGSFSDWTHQNKTQGSPSPLPPALQAMIPKEKFLRVDRDWERELACEAQKLGWIFWIFDAWVSAAKVEFWHKSITQISWPQGFCLFVETAPMPEGSQDAYWHGAWTLCYHSKITHPEQLDFNYSSWPGAPLKGHHPDHYQPRWIRLSPQENHP